MGRSALHRRGGGYLGLDRRSPPVGARCPELWAEAAAAVTVGPAAGRTTFVHRDFHPGNTIWLAGRLNGIAGWTNASWGPPAPDLAHWRANLGTRHGIAVADLATDAYRAAGGQAVDQPWWDARILLDFVGDLDTGPAGVLEATEASLAALLARRGAMPSVAWRRSACPATLRPMDEAFDDQAFEDWVAEAIDALPAAFRERLGSVAIVVEEWPTEAQLRSVGAPGLYGLYQGVPRSAWGADNAAYPSKITIFRGPLTSRFRTREAMRAKVVDTVHHEIAHHFGISDARLSELAREHGHR